jgi:hypothetical protein
MKKMMQKAVQKEKPENSNNFNININFSIRKHRILLVLTLLIIAVFVGFLIYGRSGTIAGQAYYFTGTDTAKQGVGTVWMQFIDGTAAPEDTFPVTIFYNTDTTPLYSAGFTIDYDPAMYQPISIEGVNPGFSLMPSAGGSTHLSDIAKKTPLEFMSTTGVAGKVVNLATVKFKVIGQHKTPDPSTTFTVKMTLHDTVEVISGQNEKKTVPFSADIFSSKVTIVPKCSDNDGDYYGAKGTNLKGCGGPSNIKAAISVADCDDADKSKFPGNPEQCDGKDNDCNNIIDDGMASIPNDQLFGVCGGYKVCTKDSSGKFTFMNSYDVINSPTTIITPKGTFSQDKLYSATGELGTECDYIDNNCNNKVDEGLTCATGGAAALSNPSGNVFFKWASGVYDKAGQLVDIEDLYGVFVLKDKYGSISPDPKVPVCAIKDDGHICYCLTGDYYYTKSDKSGFIFVDYDLQTRSDKIGYGVVTDAATGSLILKDNAGSAVVCS